MRHALAHWLHRAGDLLDHAALVRTYVHDHDNVRTVTVRDRHNRCCWTYDPNAA